MLSAIEAAKLVKENQEATQEEVNNALERLSNAVKALIEAADKSDLESLIKKAEAIDESKLY